MPKSLLPFHHPTQQQQSTRDHPEKMPNRAGAALQPDIFNLGVGRALLYLGVTGTITEVFTSTLAIMIEFLGHPGTSDPGWLVKLGLSVFFALCFEAGQFTLVVNLHDSWINLLEGHPEKAFVSQGEVSLQIILLWIFEFGSAGINVWWNIVALSSITTSAFLISTGCIVLLFASIVMWPLGIKVTRNAKRRQRLAKKVAAAQLAGRERQHMHPACRVSPVVESDPGRDLVPYEGY